MVIYRKRLKNIVLENIILALVLTNICKTALASYGENHCNVEELQFVDDPTYFVVPVDPEYRCI